MPCTAGGTPVTMDRLLGLVKVGTTLSAMKRLPSSSMLPGKGGVRDGGAGVREQAADEGGNAGGNGRCQIVEFTAIDAYHDHRHIGPAVAALVHIHGFAHI